MVKKRLKKVKIRYQSQNMGQAVHQAGVYLWEDQRLGVFLLLPGWDASA